ncbi:hypothetical protein NX059_010410 [Plenodomus lindquistii]|nr:hypothetical protein NX059_010410 [Plenodomus lindquistii]
MSRAADAPSAISTTDIARITFALETAALTHKIASTITVLLIHFARTISPSRDLPSELGGVTIRPSCRPVIL